MAFKQQFAITRNLTVSDDAVPGYVEVAAHDREISNDALLPPKPDAILSITPTGL